MFSPVILCGEHASLPSRLSMQLWKGEGRREADLEGAELWNEGPGRGEGGVRILALYSHRLDFSCSKLSHIHISLSSLFSPPHRCALCPHRLLRPPRYVRALHGSPCPLMIFAVAYLLLPLTLHIHTSAGMAARCWVWLRPLRWCCCPPRCERVCPQPSR